MNKADSEMISGLMTSAGHEPVASVSTADIVIFNTCSVRARAEERLYGNIRSLKNWRRSGDRLIAVGGCVAERAGSKLLKSFPYIDVVFGTRNFQNLPALIDEAIEHGKALCDIDGHRRIPEGLPTLRRHRARAWVPIIRGCSNYCSYCIVPHVRGVEVSRQLPDIIHEVNDLVSDGVKEVTLLGQNVNTYGSDLGKKGLFVDLLQKLDDVEGLDRIRFVTSHPKDLEDEMLDAIAGGKHICEYLHLPFQSGSDTMLSAMNRGYTRSQYIELIERIRDRVPGSAVSTDIIVGFPGETDEDFEMTMDIVDSVRFDQAFLFIYSPRPGTRSATLKDDVPAIVKHDRFDLLVERQNEICNEKNGELVGNTVELLVEGRSRRDNDFMAGRTRTNKVVNFKGDRSLIDRFVDIKVTAASPYSLKGELCLETDATQAVT
jgi:tRNA-2-methylthio-N6-dimethylallyladenosine synthase